MRYLLVFAGLLLWPFFAKAQYHIEFQFSDLQNQDLRIAYRYADKTYIKDTIHLNEKGIASYKGEKPLKGGMYLLIYGQQDFYEFLVADDQEFMLKTSSADPVKDMKVAGSLENELFFSSRKFLEKKRRVADSLKNALNEAEKGSKREKRLNTSLDSIKNLLTTYWKDIVKKHPDTFYATLLQANNGERGEFFDNVDFSDPRLLRTPAIYTTVRVNMARDLNAHKKPETIIKHAERMIDKSKANEEVFKYVLMYHLSFYRKFAREGIHKVFVHLADRYIKSGQATWLDSAATKDIMKTANEWRSSFVGNIAPDIEAQTPEGELVSLHNTGTRYTVLFFWKTGCGHCEEAAEYIRDFYDEEAMDLSIYAFFTKKDKGAWIAHIKKHELEDWIHVYDPKKESNYQNLFYVVSTPLAFLLDKNKRIVARKAGDTAIINMMKQLEKQRDKFSLE